MKKTFPLSKVFLLAMVVAALGFVFAGCSSSKPKVDWNARVGNYTYDQAVTELGPPDKSATLSDGKTVASWVTHRSSGGTGLSIGTGFYGGGGGVGVSQGIGSSSSYDRVLTLTFGSDHKLVSWKKNY
jgi:hypothetical protein